MSLFTAIRVQAIGRDTKTTESKVETILTDTKTTKSKVETILTDGMPKPAQWIAQVLPLTHFVEMIRGIVLRGAPITDLGTQAAKLAVFLTVALVIATLRFRKRLD